MSGLQEGLQKIPGLSVGKFVPQKMAYGKVVKAALEHQPAEVGGGNSFPTSVKGGAVEGSLRLIPHVLPELLLVRFAV